MLTEKSVDTTVPKVCSVVRPRFCTAIPIVAAACPLTSPIPVTEADQVLPASTVITAPSVLASRTARVRLPNWPAPVPPSTSDGCTIRSPTDQVLLTHATWKLVRAMVAPLARSRTIAPSVPTNT